MTKLKVVSANFWRENKKPRKSLRRLRQTRAHIIGLNEGKQLVDDIGLQVKGYVTVTGDEPHQNPVLVRDDVDLLGHGSRKMCSKVGISPARYATYVLFEHGGRRFAYVNTHANSHVQEGPADPHELPRVQQFIAHMVRLSRLVKDLRKQGYEVIVGGDFNWSWTAGAVQWFWSPKRLFRRLDLAVQWAHRTAPKQGSHRRRRIDYIAYDQTHLTIRRQWLIDSFSDHRWPVVEFGVR